MLLGDRVWAFLHDVLYEIHVIHFLSNSKSIRVLSLAKVDIICSCVALNHLLGISGVLTAAAEIVANSVVVSLVGEPAELRETLGLHHEVDSFRFLVVVDKMWHNDVYKLDQII